MTFEINDYDIIIRIGAIGMNEDEAIDQYSEILSYIRDNLPLCNYSVDVVKRGEYKG